jgi:hypothetical protein
MYPVEYARWLLNPLRYLIIPPGRIVDRLQLSPTDRVLEVGCGPGFSAQRSRADSPPVISRYSMRRRQCSTWRDGVLRNSG